MDPKLLRELMQRSDLKGLFQAGGVLVLLVASGLVTAYLFGHGLWLGFAAALFLHSSMVSIAPAANHELSHGTVFRTKWLNRAFLQIYSVLFWFANYDYALSHTYHHRYTLHSEGDREEVLPYSLPVRFLHILQLVTLNITGGPHTKGVIAIVRSTWRTALGRPLSRYAGKTVDKLEWMAAIYAGHPEQRRKAMWLARITLLFHGLVLAVGIVFQLWLLPVLVTLAPHMGNLWRYLTHVPMHCGKRTDVADFRKCARSIRLDPLTTFLYARMNWHLEHHMYAGAPCYNQRKLNRAIAADLPERKSVWGAWREMRATWRRQLVEPGYQFDTPLPTTANPSPTDPHGTPRAGGNEIESSIGDLAPSVIDD